MKTINVNPFHCEFRANNGGFTLTFFDRTEGGTELRYVVHFEFWWTRYLARHLWEAIAYRRNEVKSAEESMTREGG